MVLTDSRPRRAHVSRLARRLATDDPELLHAEPQRVRVKPEAFGGVAEAVDSPSTFAEDAFDVRPLDRDERIAWRVDRARVEAVIAQQQRVAGGVNQRPLDDVLELANVAG